MICSIKLDCKLGFHEGLFIRLPSLGWPNHTGSELTSEMLAEGLIFGHESKEAWVTSSNKLSKKAATWSLCSAVRAAASIL